MLDLSFAAEGYDASYIEARKEIDDLCLSISKQLISVDDAISEYARIEANYVAFNPEKAVLFGMIYKSRVSRLCQQFLSGGAS
jgi:hypothetical protein